MVQITQHGKARVRKRCGLPSKSVSRMVQEALDKGLKHSETTGRLNRYITALYFKNQKANNIRIYGDKVYIFSNETLITVLNLPNQYKKLAEKCFERRNLDGKYN